MMKVKVAQLIYKVIWKKDTENNLKLYCQTET